MYKVLKSYNVILGLTAISIFLFTGCPQAPNFVNSSPAIFSSDQVIIDDLKVLKDGAGVSWKLEPGNYRLEMTANNDGAAAEWVGANCAKTQQMRELNTTCEMPRSGQLSISNPSTFGLGKDVSVTIKVTKLAR